jgi:hypothetical protein
MMLFRNQQFHTPSRVFWTNSSSVSGTSSISTFTHNFRVCHIFDCRSLPEFSSFPTGSFRELLGQFLESPLRIRKAGLSIPIVQLLIADCCIFTGFVYFFSFSLSILPIVPFLSIFSQQTTAATFGFPSSHFPADFVHAYGFFFYLLVSFLSFT